MTDASPNIPAPQAVPRALWRAMRAFLCLLVDLFGDPSAIAAQGVLGRSSRTLLMPWLRAGEAFLRRLLFIEALALAPDLRAASPKPRTRTPRLRRAFEFYADKPEDWRVSFRLAPPTRRVSRPSRTNAQTPSRDPHDAWPIAERFEALLRTFNAPQKSARRLALMLLRNEPRALQTLQPAPAHIANLFGAHTFTRCNLIVASRRRRRERHACADSS